MRMIDAPEFPFSVIIDDVTRERRLPPPPPCEISCRETEEFACVSGPKVQVDSGSTETDVYLKQN